MCHVKFTVLVLPSGSLRITNSPTDVVDACVTDKKVDDDCAKLIAELEALELARAEKKAAKKKIDRADLLATQHIERSTLSLSRENITVPSHISPSSDEDAKKLFFFRSPR